MTDADPARPAKRRRTAPRRVPGYANQGYIGQLSGLFDRFGLAPVLLVVLAWFVSFKVLIPIVDSYKQALQHIDQNNALLKNSLDANQLEDTKRVVEISAAQSANRDLLEENKMLNQKILAAAEQIILRIDRAKEGSK